MQARPLFRLSVASLLLVLCSAAQALLITPVYDSSITGNTNATQIESAIQSAIDTLSGLYNNPVNISVNFSYDSAAAGNLLSTTQTFYAFNYSTYVAALQADSLTNPGNTVLSTAVSYLSAGNDASGNNPIAMSSTLCSMLGLSSTCATAANPSININSTQNFSFTQPTGSAQYDLIGGLEHELNEVLGGGGAGSWLNNVGSTPGYYGPLDLYRYSGLNNPSFTTSSTASAYFSIDGGATSITAFNQNSSGDFGDFAPSCNSNASGQQYIQNAFNCTGQYENYTTASPEFTMLSALGWNSSAAAAPPASSAPVPATLALLAVGLVDILRRQLKARA